MNYNKIKDIIIYEDNVIGKLTLDNIIEYIKLLLDDNTLFEEDVKKILESLEIDQNIIKSLMLESSNEIIKFYIDLLQNKL